MTTPVASLPEWVPNQNQPHVPHNTAIRVLEILAQLSVISRTATEPSTGVADGDAYIVPDAGATGEFSGHETQVAMYISNSFVFKTARDGWEAWVQDDVERVRFTAGSPGSWAPV
jgi:hypothetical protein